MIEAVQRAADAISWDARGPRRCVPAQRPPRPAAAPGRADEELRGAGAPSPARSIGRTSLQCMCTLTRCSSASSSDVPVTAELLWDSQTNGRDVDL